MKQKKSVSQGLLNCVASATKGAEAMYGKIEALMHLVEGSCSLLIRIQPGLIERNLLCRRRL